MVLRLHAGVEISNGLGLTKYNYGAFAKTQPESHPKMGNRKAG